MEDPDSGKAYAEALTVLVGYDYQLSRTRELPDHWRNTVAAYEEIPRRTPGKGAS